MRVSKQTTSFLLPLWLGTTPISIPLGYHHLDIVSSMVSCKGSKQRLNMFSVQDGCERQGGNMFCWGREEMEQGLGRQALDILDSSYWEQRVGLPMALFWNLFGAAQFPYRKTSLDDLQPSLRTVSQGRGKVPYYLFELPVICIARKAKVNSYFCILYCLHC